MSTHISTLSVDKSLSTHISMCHISTLSVDMSLDMSLCRYVSTYVSERPHTHTLTQNVCNLYNCRHFRKYSQICRHMCKYVDILCRHTCRQRMCAIYICVDVFANMSTYLQIYRHSVSTFCVECRHVIFSTTPRSPYPFCVA